jgi:predicted acetyltransferase
MKYLLVLVLLLPLASRADCTHNWMQCPADSSLDISGFGLRASYAIQEITAARTAATAQLKAHKITVAQAQTVLSKTDRARTLWQQALIVCNIDKHGHCDNAADDAKAYALLDWSKRAIK